MPQRCRFHTEVEAHPLEDAVGAPERLRRGEVHGAAVVVPGMSTSGIAPADYELSTSLLRSVRGLPF